MIHQRNSWWWFKLNGILRYSLVHLFSDYLPLYIVNEFPRSGGTWVSQMLSKSLDTPFPRNRLPIFEKSIIHGHHLHTWNMNNVVLVWRDGRDVLVSLYYIYLHVFDSKLNQLQVEKTRKFLKFENYENIQKNLPKFIEYSFTQKRYSWSDFVDVWYDKKDVIHVKYEELRQDTPFHLKRIFKELVGKDLPDEKAITVADEFSFTKQSGRKPGVASNKNMLRKGIVGDWKNHFNQEAKELFDYYAGKQLITLGYEKDNSWVKNGST